MTMSGTWSRRIRGALALCGASAFLLWSLVNALGVAGAPTAARGAAASAYEYQYGIGHVTGGGAVDTTNFGLEVKGDANGISGGCNVVDSQSKDHLKCTTVDSLVVTDTHATFSGTGTLNGVPTTYTIDVSDVGEPGRGRDTFSISTGAGFTRSGTLTSGNVQVRSQ
jgi:hypothetical protein